MPTRVTLKLIAAILLLVALTGRSESALAHAFLESSDPVAGAILPVAPDEIRLTFSERLEPEATSARLFDHLGAEIPGSSYRIESEKNLIVTLPVNLENGTYSIVYSNISRDDGHPARGNLPFTIGSAADLRTISVTAALDGPAGAPEWLRIGSRWLAYTGLLLSLAIWPIWTLVIAPSVRRRPTEMRVAIAAARRFSIVALTLALFGNLASLLAQALERDEPIIDALESTLFDSRFGELWQVRILLLGLLALLLAVVHWVHPGRRRFLSFAAFAASLALAVPFSLNSHAAAQVTGRAFAIAADLLHLIAAGLWGGGAILLTASLWSIRRNDASGSFRDVLRSAIPRFSGVAIAAWIVLIVSGAYAAWLQIGNLDAARATTYGNAFLVKLAIAATLLAFGATQFVIIGRRLSETVWTRRLERILIAETIGIVAILLVTGWLTSAPPAREALAQDSAGITISLNQNDMSARLFITPGAAGPNHYQLTFTGNAPADSEAVLRLTPPDGLFDQIEVPLTSVGSNVWEAHGSEFSLTGDWRVEAIVRKVGEFQWQASASSSIGAAAQALPGQPWRFGLNSFAGLLMLVIGAIALARAVTSPGGRSRKETAGIGLAGLAIGAAFLVTARLEPPPSFALADDATIARGSAIYAQQCLTCHGVTGQGNGPQAATLPVPPADFTDPIHHLHSDASLATMIQNGFPLSGMPAFVDILSAGEIADVIAYLRSLGVGASTIDVPTAADCTIAPRDITALVSISTGGEPDSLTTSEWPIGNPATNLQSDAVAETVRQFIACSNAGDYPRVLATSTLRSLAPQFATLDDDGRQAVITQAATIEPVSEGELLAIESIEPARSLPDGRLATRVVTLDPVNHPHRLEAILILAEEDGLWRIDEIHVPEAEPSAPAAASTWPLEVTSGDYTLALTLGEPGEQGQPLRIRLTDTAGNSVDGASGTIVLVPRGAGLPAELELINVDPGVYFAYAPNLAPGAYVAEVTMLLPDGTELVTGLTFVR